MKLMNSHSILAVEIGKLSLGASAGGGSATAAAIGKGICDVVEFSAKKIDAKRGVKNSQYNPLNVLESMEVALKRLFKKA